MGLHKSVSMIIVFILVLILDAVYIVDGQNRGYIDVLAQNASFEIMGGGNYTWITPYKLNITWFMEIYDRDTHEPLGENVTFFLSIIHNNETVFFYRENLSDTYVVVWHVFDVDNPFKPYCFTHIMGIYDPSGRYQSVNFTHDVCIYPDPNVLSLLPTGEPPIALVLLFIVILISISTFIRKYTS